MADDLQLPVPIDHRELYRNLGFAAMTTGGGGLLFSDLNWWRATGGVFLILLGCIFFLRAFKLTWFLTSPSEEVHADSSNVLQRIQVPSKTKRRKWFLFILLALLLAALAGFAHYRIFGGKESKPVIPIKIASSPSSGSVPPALKGTSPSGSSGGKDQLQESTTPARPFPFKPLELLGFSALDGGTLRNVSDERLFVEVLATSSKLEDGESSLSYLIETEIGPHKEIAFKNSPVSGTWETLPPNSNDDWDTEWRRAKGLYGLCAQPLPFLPDSLLFKQVVNHYHAMNLSIPVGNATGTISYRKDSAIKEETISLKALIFVRQQCTPQR